MTSNLSVKPSSPATLEEALDVVAFCLATDPRTSGVQWIVGDVGMGSPSQLPFGYITPFNESVRWYTSGGGASGPAGVDDWDEQVILTVAFERHRHVSPVAAVPPALSPVSGQTLGHAPPFFEQPGYRAAMQLASKIADVFRDNITMSGELATTRIGEMRYLLQNIEGKMHRAARVSVVAQQRRPR